MTSEQAWLGWEGFQPRRKTTHGTGRGDAGTSGASEGSDGGSFARPSNPFDRDAQFDGPWLQPDDMPALSAQGAAVWDAMRRSDWLTLAELSQRTGHPEASVSARLRDLRKAKFGSHVVECRRRADTRTREYRLSFRTVYES